METYCTKFVPKHVEVDQAKKLVKEYDNQELKRGKQNESD